MIRIGARVRLAAIAVGVAWFGLDGSACRREPPVATALETAGTVERASGGAWTDVQPGGTFVVGDALRTAPSSRARLALLGGGVIRVGPNARLRFQRGAVVGQQIPDIAVELGSAEVEDTASSVSILTAIGTARIDRGARVNVRADGQTASLEVVVGRAVMLDAGRELPIDAGQGVRIRLGSAELERFAFTIGDAVVETARPAGGGARVDVAADNGGSPEARDGGAAAPETPPAESADAGRAGADNAPRPLENERNASTRATRPDTSRADVTLQAGESATLHDGRPPATVRLRVDRLCHGDAAVEVGGHGHHRERFTGSEAVVVKIGPGTWPYRVRCAADRNDVAPRAAGVLTLRRDTGYVPLARRAPVNVIDADGRRYTVLFQTRLPQLTLAWPAAPAGATALELHVESPSGERVVHGMSANRPLPSAAVQEGTSTFWYRAPDGKQSPKTTVSIRFDNAAPTAQFFRTAAAAGGGPRGAVTIDGVTVDGAKVSIGGQPISVDGHGRFRAEAAPLAADDAVAVRLEHPRTGVHYYVRRRADTR